MKYILLILLPLHLLMGLNIENSQEHYTHFKIFSLYDSSNKLKIEDIPTQNFKKGPSQFTYGYLEGTRWFKLSLNNHADKSHFILSFTEPLWKEFDLYTLKNGQWEITQAGLFTPLKNRNIRDINPAFSINIAPGESQTLYIKGRSSSSQLGAFELYSADAYFNPTRFNLIDVYLFFIIFLAVIIFFNLYLFSARREKLYLLYIGYLFSLIIWFSVKSGLYLILDTEAWDQGLHTTGALFILLLTLFSQEFLELKKRFHLMHKVFSSFALIFFLLAIAIALEIPYTPLIFNLISSVFFTLLLFVSIKVYRQWHLEMRYYLLALFVYMPTMGMLTLTFNGLIPNTDITRYAFLLGSFVKIIFFNALMISHYHIVFKEKIRLQEESIKLKEEKERVLEGEIDTQMQELQEKNKALTQKTQELESVQENLRLQATTDPLTGLYNRRYLLGIAGRVFDNALRYAHSLSVIMIDLDNFKQINDTYGHALGDEVLINCAKVLQNDMRSSDLLARYGGEEFLIFVPNTPVQEVLELADRILKNSEQEKIPFANEAPLSYTMSIGITHLQENDLNMEQLINRADKAMYLAKSKGKNCIEVL